MRKFSRLVFPYLIWSVVMLLVPMLLIVLYSFIKNGNGILSFQLGLDHYVRFFTDPDFLLILWRSLWIALKTTLLCLVLGYPLAYLIARRSKKVQNWLILAITLPMWINMLVRTYAWIGLLGSDGLLSWFGIKANLLYTETAVLIGMVYNFLPYMILQVHAVLVKMDHSLIEASADLGADRLTTFRRVIFPLSLSGVVSGIALVFLPAVSSFFIPKLLGGGQFFLIGNVIENQFITVGEWSFGSAISVIMAMIMMLTMMVVRRLERRSPDEE